MKFDETPTVASSNLLNAFLNEQSPIDHETPPRRHLAGSETVAEAELRKLVPL